MQNRSQIARYTMIALPDQKYIPGQGIHPDKNPKGSHIPKVPQDLEIFSDNSWLKSQRYLYAIDLFNYGYWWEAHEVLEKLWIQTGKTSPMAEFIQGIIQISAALLKDSQLMSVGASKLVSKGLQKLRKQSGNYLGINVNDFVSAVESYFSREGIQKPKIILMDLESNSNVSGY